MTCENIEQRIDESVISVAYGHVQRSYKCVTDIFVGPHNNLHICPRVV